MHYPPKVALSKLVNNLKGASSHYLRQVYTGTMNQTIMHVHLWAPRASPVPAAAPIQIVKAYIENQKRPD